jgi:hypothetical protein
LLVRRFWCLSFVVSPRRALDLRGRSALLRLVCRSA